MNNSLKVFTRDFWNRIIKESFLQLFDNAIEIIEAESQVTFQEKARQMETPKFAPPVSETPKFMDPNSNGAF